MNSFVKVSVIVPIYNAEKYINRCLSSIQKNTYENLEIICINDGSTDNSLQILNEIKKNDERIIIVSQQNSGVSEARNMGIEKSTGDVLSFIDSDDWIHNKYFEILLSVYEKEKSDVVMCGSIDVNEGKSDEIIDIKGINIKNISIDSFFTYAGRNKQMVWGKIYSRNLINNIRFKTNLKIGEDTVFNVNIFTQNRNIKISIIEEQLYYYFSSNTESITHSNSDIYMKEMANEYLDMYATKENELKDIYLMEACKAGLAYRYSQSLTRKNSEEYRNIINKCKNLLMKNNSMD